MISTAKRITLDFNLKPVEMLHEMTKKSRNIHKELSWDIKSISSSTNFLFISMPMSNFTMLSQCTRLWSNILDFSLFRRVYQHRGAGSAAYCGLPQHTCGTAGTCSRPGTSSTCSRPGTSGTCSRPGTFGTWTAPWHVWSATATRRRVKV